VAQGNYDSLKSQGINLNEYVEDGDNETMKVEVMEG
jgi:hypothetical protein